MTDTTWTADDSERWVNDQLVLAGAKDPREPWNMLAVSVAADASVVSLVNRVEPGSVILIIDGPERWELVHLDKVFGSGPFTYTLAADWPRIGHAHSIGALVKVRPTTTVGLVEDAMEGYEWR